MDNNLEDKAEKEKEKKIDGILSKNIIRWLQKTTGDNYKQIGRKLELSLNSVYQISEGRRGLTLYRLRQMETAYNIPIPLIFLLATKKSAIPRQLRSQYASLYDRVSKVPEFKKYF